MTPNLQGAPSEDVVLSGIYGQLAAHLRTRFAAAYDTRGGLARFTSWLEEHVHPEPATGGHEQSGQARIRRGGDTPVVRYALPEEERRHAGPERQQGPSWRRPSSLAGTRAAGSAQNSPLSETPRREGTPLLSGHPGGTPVPEPVMADAWPRPPDQMAVTATLSAKPQSARAGREFTRAALAGWGMTNLTDIATLVVSELITHALRHSFPEAGNIEEDRIRVRLVAKAPFVMCMVTDPRADIPVLRDPGPHAEDGRELNIVESCSVRWGWHLLDEGGRIVWALLRP